jgi:F420-dependent oxidoreductase-like protein
MRIGLAALGSGADRVIAQAQRAEADGFATLWFTGAVPGDPFIPMTLAARATTSIEVATAVQQTYAAHPLLQAARALSAAEAIGTPARFALGVGPSHRPAIEGRLGLSYETPGRHTDEYVQILTALLRGEQVTFAGQEFTVNAGPLPLPAGLEVPVLVAALGPRLLRVAGQYTAGTIPWMANAQAIETHIAPIIRAAAAEAGRPAPRIAAGLPVAVHDDVAEARAAAAEQFATYGQLPNYQRILAHGGLSGPAEAVIVGNEASVTSQVKALFEAGATDVWLPPFPVGPDRSASRARTRALLKDLAQS